MSFYEILNSIDLALGKNINSYNNSIVDNFVDELKKYLAVANSMEKLSKVPEDTLFTLDRYEYDYAVCENRTTGEMFDMDLGQVFRHIFLRIFIIFSSFA